MLLKLLAVIIVILAAAWAFAGGRAALPGRGGARSPAPPPRADDLISCGRCGVWMPAGQRCDCAGQA